MMGDELNQLQAALKRREAKARPDAKARALALAQKNFETFQGSASEARLISERPGVLARIWRGTTAMITTQKLRPMLYATSCLAVAGLAFVLIRPDGPADLKHITSGPTAVDLTQERNAVSEQTVAPQTSVVTEYDAQYDMALSSPPVAQSKRAESGLMPSPIVLPEGGYEIPLADSRDQFEAAEANSLKITSDDPVSTFSIDVDTASYSFVRSSVLNGSLPPADAVRVEEMINYFPYDYPEPKAGGAPFSTNISVFGTPWNKGTQLVHIGIQGAKPAIENRPPLNLVFLIDTSGSMNAANKLPLLKQSFRLLLSRLRPEDKVAIVTYAGSSGLALAPTSAADHATILDSLSRLDAGGSTAGHQGLQLAYQTAESMAQEGRLGRVILATDGDFNVGISDRDALEDYIADKRDTGVYLSVLGFGRGNYNDALMQRLAQNGNGMAAYIDTLAEAQKLLVDQVSGALFPIADDVKIQIEFNPSVVAEYRLIGYETRILAREDFNNDRVDAGEIGAGHNVTAIYEVTPVGSEAIRNDPLRYQADVSGQTGSGEMGFLKLRYKTPGASESKLLSSPIPATPSSAPDEAQFATAIAGFGQLLIGRKYLGDWGWEDAIALANKSKGPDPYGYRTEAIGLMRLGQSLR